MGTGDADRDEWFQTLGKDRRTSDKSWNVAFVLSLLVGWLGADRFYLGSAWLGMLKLFTLGGLGVWWLADIVLLLCNAMRDGEDRMIAGPRGRR